MPTVNVKIQPTIINWALSQTKEEKLGAKLMKNIEQWLSGAKCPTFRQVEDFSRRSNIPLGYFFLQTPPEEQIKLLEYRTIDSIRLTEPSRDLIDTIHEMESVQQWMHDYRKEAGYELCSYLGCVKNIRQEGIIAERIRSDLGLDQEWYKDCNDRADAFLRIKNFLSECGIIVMMNGVAGKNTHRALDLNEFRAFAMTDDLAPLIFINATDSWGGRLFSLFHETVHIWFGENDLYNDLRGLVVEGKDVEKVCNAVAAELMVPDKVFLKKWDENEQQDISFKTKDLAKYFLCSESVIARKALDNKRINKIIYDEIVEEAIEAFGRLKQEKASGGNYYSTAQSRLDKVFVRSLCDSINSGRTSYTEAYRLTNTTGKTFFEVASRLGGVLW